MLKQAAPEALKKIEDFFLFLTLLFLPTQLGLHFWPKFSYIYSLKIDYLSPVVYFWDILVMLLFILWIFGKPRINKLALNLMLLFLFTQALSLLGTANLGAGLVRLEQYIIAGFFGIYLSSLQNKKAIYLPLLLGVLGESLIAILQFIHGATLGLWILGERSFSITTPGIAKFDIFGMQFLRPYGTFPHPNVLAGYMLIVSSILYQVSWGRQKIFKIALLFSGISIFLTMSRTAILYGFILLVFLRKKFLILLVLLLTPVLFIRFSSILNFDNLALLRREELIGSAWQLFLKSPLYGIGLNNFIPALANNLISGPSRFLQPAHNIFFLTLAETGIIGLTGLIIMIGYPIVKKANLLPWLIIIFLGLFDHYFLTLPQGYRLLFLVWGLSLSRVKIVS
ncbi:MAG: O-antigen ligase family protein [Candidatus Daviesbacteria bacterium]|nr:O-antigen ligase family protein [Candidatus Daviesbacteria bacterium]